MRRKREDGAPEGHEVGDPEGEGGNYRECQPAAQAKLSAAQQQTATSVKELSAAQEQTATSVKGLSSGRCTSSSPRTAPSAREVMA